MPKKIFSITISFKALNNTVIPPFSAKVSKLIMHRLSSLYKAVMESKSPFKPVSITPLIHNGRALIKVNEYKYPLTLRQEELYSFRVTIINDDNINMNSLLNFEEQRIDDVFKASILLESIMVEVKDFCNLTVGKPKLLRIGILSPLLLQLPTYGRFLDGRYLLFPLQSIMIRSLMDHWNNNCDPVDRIKRSIYLPIYSNYSLVEADFNIKPVTVYYDNTRRPRGITGWIVYEVRARRRGIAYRDLMRLLDYASM